MDDKRQKNQLKVAFMEESRSEAPMASKPMSIVRTLPIPIGIIRLDGRRECFGRGGSPTRNA
jgi:hypothetical protein